jgi:hypothetical protein
MERIHELNVLGYKTANAPNFLRSADISWFVSYFSSVCYVVISIPHTFTTITRKFIILYNLKSGFGGLEVACWPLIPKFAGSNLAEAVEFFGRKIPQHAFLRRGSKAVCPMSCFTACKRTQKWRGSRHFRKNSRPFLAHGSIFRCWVRWRRFRRWGPLVANALNPWFSSKLGVRRSAGNGTL